MYGYLNLSVRRWQWSWNSEYGEGFCGVDEIAGDSSLGEVNDGNQPPVVPFAIGVDGTGEIVLEYGCGDEVYGGGGRW